MINKLRILILAAALAVGATFVSSVLADTHTINFESYSNGTINGQDGWTSTGAAGSGCAVYDHAVDSSLSTTGFGSKSLRISNAVTSGCFGDMTFAKPLVDSVGESGSTAGSYPAGTKQNRFEMEFDIASTVPGAQQPGLFMSVSPDRGDGSRMSYIGFEDDSTGINIIFYDVQGTSNPSNFVLTDLGTYDRSVPHHIKLTLDTIEGASNDVVKVWIDGVLVHTGTSWENYYRFDSEASAEQSVRIVRTVLFRTGGAAVPANAGKGFLVDNLTLESLTPVLPTIPSIISPADGATVTVSNMTEVDWSDSTGGTFPPFEYQYESYGDAGYASLLYSSGWLTSSEIATPGTPPGEYYLRVRARDSEGNMTDWSNDDEDPHHITVVADPVNPFPVPAQCNQNISYNLITGTNGSDNINGTNGNDLILALGNSDRVDGKGGDDCIVGGDGSDRLTGANGADVILGGDGSDSIDGGNQNDDLYGQGGSDSINGGNQEDDLFGGDDSDSLRGGNHNDNLLGGDGSDSLRGEGGNDTLNGEDGVDSANGGGNTDTCTAEAESACEL